MKARSWRGIVLAATLSLIHMAPAQAAPITRTFGISAHTFNYLIAALPAPIDPVSVNVTITFDPLVNALEMTTGIALNSSNLPLSSAIGWSMLTGVNQLNIGGILDSVAVMYANFDDWGVLISDPAGPAPTFLGMTYGVQGTALGLWTTNLGSVTVTDLPAAVPEPASLALLSAGLIGLAMRRRRSSGA